jgi:hypothetical protein
MGAVLQGPTTTTQHSLHVRYDTQALTGLTDIDFTPSLNGRVVKDSLAAGGWSIREISEGGQ